MTITAFHVQGALAIAVCSHILLWARTGEGIWYWLSVLFATLRRAEITTYRWAIPAWRAWVDEFKHFKEPSKITRDTKIKVIRRDEDGILHEVTE